MHERYYVELAKQEKLLSRKNEKSDFYNGVFDRYVNPVLTRDMIPLTWRYDLNEETNPFFMERLGINAVMNSGAIYLNGKYYLVATFGSEKHKGIQILQSDTPDGTFQIMTETPLTPDDWNCIDGMLYQEKEKIYLIFSHSFEDVPAGDMCMVELEENLSCIKGKIITLFSAKDADWAVPIPFAKTDGPAVYRQQNGKLLILWSSWGEKGYTVGQAVSDSGKIEGPWRHLEQIVFGPDGGHGMFFHTKEGALKYLLHYPNQPGDEHPLLLELAETELGLKATLS